MGEEKENTERQKKETKENFWENKNNESLKIFRSESTDRKVFDEKKILSIEYKILSKQF